MDVENGKLKLGAEALALLLDGVDLKDVLGRLPHIKAEEARELTPAKWLAARSPASRIA